MIKHSFLGLGLFLALVFIPVPYLLAERPPFFQQPTEEKYYTDSYNLIFNLGERSFVKLEILLTNLSIGATRGVCQVFYFKGGQAKSFQVHTSPKAWKAVPAKSLQVVGCSLVKDKESLLVRAKIKDFDFTARVTALQGLRLKFDDISPIVSKIIRPSGEFESSLALPANSAQYELKYNNQPLKSGSVTMILYRFWATAAPKDVAEVWARSYLFQGKDTKIIFAFKEKEATQWQATQFDTRLGATTAKAISANYKLDDEKGILTGFSSKGSLQEFYRYDFVKEMGWYGPLLSIFVNNPVTHFFYSDSEVDSKSPSLSPKPNLIEFTKIN